MSGMTLGRDGRLYVAGYLRVLEFDPLGRYVGSWRPRAPVAIWDVCESNGQPAIVTSGGVIRRGPDGTDEDLGRDIADRRARSIRETPMGRGQVISGYHPRIACADDAAYVVTTSAEGPDSVFVYRRNGETATLAVPTEFTDRGDDCTEKVDRGIPGGWEMPCTNWAQDLKPVMDGRGDLVLLGRDHEVAGAIIDPETGCYGVLRKPEPARSYDALNIYQDSALVFHYSPGVLPPGLALPPGAVAFPGFSTAADRISLHPLRRIGGEPCPGMLPSVEDVG